MQITDQQVLTAARAIDKVALVELGWGEADIALAFEAKPHPAEKSIALARVALTAAFPQSSN